MTMDTVLPFRLRVSGSDRVRDFEAVSTSFRFAGTATLDGDVLRLAWTGHARVQEVGLLSVRDDELALPHEELAVPVSDLAGAALAGGWWRPRLELRGRDPSVLEIIPGEDDGLVQLWIARRDRNVARALQAALAHRLGLLDPA